MPHLYSQGVFIIIPQTVFLCGRSLTGRLTMTLMPPSGKSGREVPTVSRQISIQAKRTRASQYSWASLVAQMVKNLPAMQETWVRSWVKPSLGRPPEGGHGNPLQYSCLENPHGQRSLADYSPWGCKESDTTGQLNRAQ